eukprot:16301400-Heterocapsa_arctica.AAC.1
MGAGLRTRWGRSGPRLSGASHAVSVTAWGGFPRAPDRCPQPGRHQEARPVAVRPQRAALREGRP